MNLLWGRIFFILLMISLVIVYLKRIIPEERRKQMNRATKIILAIVLVLVIGLIAAGNYFYSYAVVPAKKDFLESSSSNKSTELVTAETWFNDKNNRTDCQLDSKDGLNLSAYYLPAENESNKTVIIAHGYMGQASDMPQYAKSTMTLATMF